MVDGVCKISSINQSINTSAKKGVASYADRKVMSVAPPEVTTGTLIVPVQRGRCITSTISAYGTVSYELSPCSPFKHAKSVCSSFYELGKCDLLIGDLVII